MKKLVHFLALVSLVTLSACSPNLGLSISVPPVPNPQRSVPADLSSNPVRVRVGTFIDSRTDDTIAVIDGRRVAADGSLPATVQEGLERYLKTAGASVVLTSAPVIEGEITQWNATIHPGFPFSEATAVARIKIMVRGEDSKIFYRANYSGEATKQHPWLTESGVRDLISEAMGSALEEVANDADLVTQLSRARSY